MPPGSAQAPPSGRSNFPFSLSAQTLVGVPPACLIGDTSFSLHGFSEALRRVRGWAVCWGQAGIPGHRLGQITEGGTARRR